MAAKKLTTDTEVSTAVDALLVSLGVPVTDDALPGFETAVELSMQVPQVELPPSADVDALWGGAPKKRK